MPKNLFASFMRTAVPLAVAWVLAASGWLGIPVSDTSVRDLVAVVLAGAYYLAFRLLEEYAGKLKVPWLQRVAGVLLGWARPPQYPAPSGPDADVARLARGRP